MFSGPKLYQCSHCKTTKLGAVTSAGAIGNGTRDILPEGWGYCYAPVGVTVQMFIICSELCSEEFEEGRKKPLPDMIICPGDQ